MKKIILSCISIVMCASLVSCSSNPQDALAGEYTDAVGGEARAKVIKQEGEYFLSIQVSNNNWKSGKLENISDEDFEKLLGKEWRVNVKFGGYAKIEAKGKTLELYMLKVGKGFEYKGHSCETGYVIIAPLASSRPQNLYKL